MLLQPPRAQKQTQEREETELETNAATARVPREKH